jgi:hypothetical protein
MYEKKNGEQISPSLVKNLHSENNLKRITLWSRMVDVFIAYIVLGIVGTESIQLLLPLQLAEAHLIVAFYMALYPEQYDKSILADVHSSCTDSPWTFSKYPV